MPGQNEELDNVEDNKFIMHLISFFAPPSLPQWLILVAFFYGLFIMSLPIIAICGIMRLISAHRNISRLEP